MLSPLTLDLSLVFGFILLAFTPIVLVVVVSHKLILVDNTPFLFKA